jgi:hypothetical protein
MRMLWALGVCSYRTCACSFNYFQKIAFYAVLFGTLCKRPFIWFETPVFAKLRWAPHQERPKKAGLPEEARSAVSKGELKLTLARIVYEIY